MKFIVWIKDLEFKIWVPNVDGPLTEKQAQRIAREIRKECGVATKYLPIGMDPGPLEKI